MAIRHIVAVFEADGLTPTEKLVLLKLADNANDDGLCWPSREHIVRHTGCSAATVKRTLKALKAKGFVDVERQFDDGGMQGVNLYRLTVSIGGLTVSPRGAHSDPPRGAHSEPLNHKQSTPKGTKRARARARDGRFEEFWREYPKKRDKKKAREAWKRKRLDDIADQIVDDVRTRKSKDGYWSRGYIPLATTYLNGERWEDELEPIDESANQSDEALRAWRAVVDVSARSKHNQREFLNRFPGLRKPVNAVGGLSQIGRMDRNAQRQAKETFIEIYSAGAME